VVPGVSGAAARARRPLAQPPLRMSGLFAQLVLIGLVLTTLVAFAGSAAIRRIAESQSVHDVAQLTDVIAQSVVQPALTDSISDPVSATAALDALIRADVLSDSLLRVKLWSAEGTVVYSDETRLSGRNFGLDDEARQALSAPQTTAAVSDLRRPENLYERGQGKLLEVYRPVWAPGGREFLLETYYRYDMVSARSSQLWRAFLGITASSLAVLILLMIPIIATLLGRVRRSQAQREDMLRRGMDSSTEERQRIAAALHDGAVQELAAAAFAVAAATESAAARGDAQLAADLGRVAATVRSGVGGLRALVVDIYPPSLESAGLTAALTDMASTVAGRTPQVELAVDEQLAWSLNFEQQQAVFRVVQECLRNAVKHARASAVVIALDGTPDEFELTVQDNGSGFDVATVLTAGGAHLGLRLMADVAAAIGAELAVSSFPGHGTTWRLAALA
jgi:two-component system NarL family sensor kinase